MWPRSALVCPNRVGAPVVFANRSGFRGASSAATLLRRFGTVGRVRSAPSLCVFFIFFLSSLICVATTSAFIFPRNSGFNWMPTQRAVMVCLLSVLGMEAFPRARLVSPMGGREGGGGRGGGGGEGRGGGGRGGGGGGWGGGEKRGGWPYRWD
jgi:hypothetical protein